MNRLIRPARVSDAAACAAVYAPYIDTAITFEYPAPGADEFARRIEGTMRVYPWLVCESGGAVTGYAYAHRFRERAAYDWSAELSVYLAPGAAGRGAGSALYGALCELLARQGFVNAYGTVSTPNPPSERLHEKCGFSYLFTMRSTGWKLGAWRSLAYYHRQLRPCGGEPAPVVPFPELDGAYVKSVCEKYSRGLNHDQD